MCPQTIFTMNQEVQILGHKVPPIHKWSSKCGSLEVCINTVGYHSRSHTPPKANPAMNLVALHQYAYQYLLSTLIAYYQV